MRTDGSILRWAWLTRWLTALLFAGVAFGASAEPLTGRALSGTGLPFANGSTATVGSGVEFFYRILGSNDGMQFDFDDSGLLTVSLLRPVAGSHSFAGSGFVLTFTDISHGIAPFTGFSLVGLDRGVSGIDLTDLSFTADSLSLRLGNTRWASNATARFQIAFAGQPMPEPGTLALIALGLAGFLFVRRRA